MKTIILMTSLLLISCDEPDGSHALPERCSGTLIEEFDDGDWYTVLDCAEYVVGHSGKICPRDCCEFEQGVSCGYCPK